MLHFFANRKKLRKNEDVAGFKHQWHLTPGSHIFEN